MSEPAENDAPFHTPTEALEHIVIMLERGESVPYWAITEARALLDSTPPPDVNLIARAINDTGLLGCGCCVDGAAYDSDGCPTDPDGPWVDHAFLGDCIHEVGRDVYIARAVVRALTEEAPDARA